MNASEALYFTNAPVLHIVQHEERKRLARIQAQAQAAFRAAPSHQWAPLVEIPPVPLVQPCNELLLSILFKDGPLTPAEAAYVARCEAEAE
jgi:hypothetical protein